MHKRRIFLFEGELKTAKGHHLRNLVASSNTYKNHGEIFWVLNKEFDKGSYYIPDHIKIIKKIDTANRKINHKNFIDIILIILKNFFISFVYLLFSKDYRLILKNFFRFPKYFGGFTKVIEELKPDNEDILIFQAARINDFELANFLKNLKKYPEIHLRLTRLHRKRKLKKFYKIIEEMKNENKLFNKIFVYTETDFYRERIIKDIGINFDLFYNNIPIYNRDRKTNTIFNIGFLGESRVDKGFDKIPNILNYFISKKNSKINFYIQIHKVPSILNNIKNEIYNLANENKNIQIIEGYIDFNDYSDLLKKVDIIPLLHTEEQLKQNGSQIVFESIANEIPMVINLNARYVKIFFKYNSFIEAENYDDFPTKIEKLIENYNHYLDLAKLQSAYHLEKIHNDKINHKILNKN
jgi:hypothetical protein